MLEFDERLELLQAEDNCGIAANSKPHSVMAGDAQESKQIFDANLVQY